MVRINLICPVHAMLDKLTIAQRLWLWAILATLLFFAAVGFGWYALFHARETLRVVHEERQIGRASCRERV